LKGLPQIVVGPGVQGRDDVLGRVLGGKYQDRQFLSLLWRIAWITCIPDSFGNIMSRMMRSYAGSSAIAAPSSPSGAWSTA